MPGLVVNGVDRHGWLFLFVPVVVCAFEGGLARREASRHVGVEGGEAASTTVGGLDRYSARRQAVGAGNATATQQWLERAADGGDGLLSHGVVSRYRVERAVEWTENAVVEMH
jgi:hypothetical protein